MFHLLGLYFLLLYSENCYSGKTAYIDLPDEGLHQSPRCNLKNTYHATLRTENVTIILQLKKNMDVDGNVPVYVPRRDENGIVRIIQDSVLDIQDSAEYQDISNFASVEISCKLTELNTFHLKLRGTLSLSGGAIYSIELLTRTKRSVQTDLPGDVYELLPAGEDEDATESTGQMIDEVEPNEATLHPFHYVGGRRRRKRQTQSIYIDVVTFVDNIVYRRWYNRSEMVEVSLRKSDTTQNIRRYFALLLNGINLRYKSASQRYNIRLVGYVIEDEEQGDWFTSVSDQENGTSIHGLNLLRSAQRFTSRARGFPDHDHIITWTGKKPMVKNDDESWAPFYKAITSDRYDVVSAITYHWLTTAVEKRWHLKRVPFPKQPLCNNLRKADLYTSHEGARGNLLGIAWVGTICRYLSWSISLVEYRERVTDDMLTATHEMGHALSARHDGYDGTYANNCSANGSYIMEDFYTSLHSLDHNNQYLFSSCSENYFRNYINGLLLHGTNYSRTCLLDTLTAVSVMNVSGVMPGQLYGPDTQCRMAYGESAYMSRLVRNVCKRMSCCFSGHCYYLNAAEGTSCGNKKWCIAGNCIDSDDAPERNSSCLFGDTPYQTPCGQHIPSTRKYMCYNEANRQVCCGTCLKYAANKTDCKYGDNRWTTTCISSQCLARNGTSYIDACCDTCRAFRPRTTTVLPDSTSSVPQTSATSTYMMTTSTRTATATGTNLNTTYSAVTSSNTTYSSSPTSSVKSITSATATTSETISKGPVTATTMKSAPSCLDDATYEELVGSSCFEMVKRNSSVCKQIPMQSKCCASCSIKSNGQISETSIAMIAGLGSGSLLLIFFVIAASIICRWKKTGREGDTLEMRKTPY